MDKNLKYFMRDSAKVEQVVEVPGLPSIVDDDGNVVPFKIRKLHNDRINEINELYRSRVPLKDKKGNFIVQNGEVVFKTERDSARATRHIIVESLVEPDLKDAELMKFFGCVDITQMPLKVFPENDEYGYVSRKVLEVLGMLDPEEKEDVEIEDAKN